MAFVVMSMPPPTSFPHSLAADRRNGRGRWPVGLVAAALCFGLSFGGLASADAGAQQGSAYAAQKVPVNAEQPLKRWMTTTVQPAKARQDEKVLSSAFAALEQAAPEGFDGWASIALSGREGADSGDFRQVRRACMTCHMKYRRRYQKAFGQRAWPPTKKK